MDGPWQRLGGTGGSVEFQHLGPEVLLSGYTEQCFVPLQWLSCMSKRMFPSVSNAVQCFPPDCKFSSWSCVSAPCLWVVLNLNLLFVQPTLLVGCFKFNFTFWRIFDISTRFPSFPPFLLLPPTPPMSFLTLKFMTSIIDDD